MLKRYRCPSNFGIFIFLSTILIVATTFYLVYYYYHSNSDNVTNRINTVTNARMDQLIEKTNDLIDILNVQVDSNLISIDISNSAQDGISHFVEKDGKLVYWSDNLVSFESVKETENIHKSILNLPNGWYLYYHEKLDSFDVTSLALIKHTYPYTNDYLRNSFQKQYHLPLIPEISEIPAQYNVNDDQGNFLFSLHFPEKKLIGSSPTHWGLLFMFLLSYAVVLWILFYLHKKLNPFPKYPNLPIFAFIIDLFIIRWLIFHFAFPFAIHHFYIFNPQLYASSLFNRSLGDLLLNALSVLIIAWIISFHWITRRNQPTQRSVHPKAALLFFFIAILALAHGYTIKALVLDSTLTFNLINLLSVDAYSFMGLLIIVMASAAFMLLVYKCYEGIVALSGSKKGYLLASIPAFIFVGALAVIYSDVVSFMALLVYGSIVLIRILPANRKEDFFVNRILLLLVIVSVAVTWLINAYDGQKEKELMTLVAVADANKDDPMAEYLFGNAKELMYCDTALAEMLFHDSIDENTAITYLLKKYFGSGEHYWARYNFQVTICSQPQNLIIEGQNQVVNCFDFFKKQSEEFGILTMTKGFYLIYDPFGQANYLGMLQFENGTQYDKDPVKVFIEIFSKIVPVEVGYLDLLVDKAIKEEASIYKYAHARYHHDQLVSSYGKYIYSIDQSSYPIQDTVMGFFEKGGYTHFYFPSANNKMLVVSLPEKNLLDKIAPFSLFLLFFILIYTTGLTIRNVVIKKNPLNTNFKNRLQLTLLLVILFSFIVIGIASVYYISMLNENKNTDNLKDKARSIRIEVEHKLADKAILNEELKPYIESLLLKFNDVFATDINIFDTDGKLLGTSRQRIYNEGLISRRMNTKAYREMVLHQKTLLMHEEHIGELKYLSAYIPFKNNQNRIIAYINLPYFARQSELSNEISSFLMTFINIYLLLIAITIIFAFFLSDRISKPLIIIRERMQQVRLGAPNEKIEWRGRDEISDLVNEYNRMVDELERSAELLAKSERETAWREMARQVAHEIKNPLTPMKLNLQHLEKTITGDPDQWREQFSRFSRVMLQQIDSLSAIATAFSDFANMPRGTTSLVSLEEIIIKAAALFEGYRNVHIITNIDPANRAEVNGDSEQLSRVVINLINNAVQAKIADKLLTVTVSLKYYVDHWLLTVQDNGKGISNDISNKIFMPNFTTKTSGMGLGLAMAKNIIEGMGGSISFRSEPLKGTTFSVVLPIES